jgi:hypothetical protein
LSYRRSPRLLGGELVFARVGLEFFEFELHLIEKPRLALGPLAIKLAPHLLDREPQMRNQSLGARGLVFGVSACETKRLG